MSYYNRYRNKRKNPEEAAGSRQADLPDAIFELGKNKRVTVRQFRNFNLVDIREYYVDSTTGEMKPGKKGISLTEDVYDELLKHRLNIDDALRRLGSKRPRMKTVSVLSDSEDGNNKENHGAEENGRDYGEGQSDSTTEHTSKKPKRNSNPAPPQLLPDEVRRQLDERENNATLVIPGANGQEKKKKKLKSDNPRLDDHLPKLALKKAEKEPELDSSDEDFALALESEVTKSQSKHEEEEISEEE